MRRRGLETPQRSRERSERWNGFQQSSNAERIAHAPGRAHEAQTAALARQPSALAHQRADAGTVNLNESAQVHQHFPPPLGGKPLQLPVEKFAVFAQRGAAARLDHNDVAILARGDFEFLVIGVHFLYAARIGPNLR